MNILYVITGLGLGGAETITVNIANGMYRRGHRVAILYFTGDNWFKDKIDEGIIVKKINISKHILSFLKAQYVASKFLEEFCPQIVHGNMIHANVFARVLRLYNKIPYLISTEHSKTIGGYFRLKIYQYTDFLSNLNTNVSEEATNHFILNKAFNPTKSKTVYNGIDLNRFQADLLKRKYVRDKYSISDDDFVFLNVGRLTTAKDQESLLLAFKEVHMLYSYTKLIIVGDGELKNALIALACELKIDKFVLFSGASSNVEEYYCSADCFVLSSAWEGFGLVLAEAMATSLPVITTDAGGCAEVINASEYVVPVKNVFLLSKKMKEFVEMPLGDRKKIGMANNLKSRKFDIKTAIDHWEEIYLERTTR